MFDQKEREMAARMLTRLSEALRHFFRRLIGVGPLYKRGADLLNAAMILRKEGVRGSLALLRVGKLAPGQRVELAVRSLSHPFTIRTGCEDFQTLVSNVVREEYGKFDPGEPAWMIDGGAFIGDTSAYFLTRFPRLKVIALEPEPRNHALAKINLDFYGARVELLRRALYSEDGVQRFCGASTSATIGKVGDEIETVSIPSLMRRYKIDRIDILKLDIEGAEKALFARGSEVWLPQVSWILIETHGEHTHEIVADALLKAGFGMRLFRSVWYCHRHADPHTRRCVG